MFLIFLCNIDAHSAMKCMSMNSTGIRCLFFGTDVKKEQDKEILNSIHKFLGLLKEKKQT